MTVRNFIYIDTTTGTQAVYPIDDTSIGGSISTLPASSTSITNISTLPGIHDVQAALESIGTTLSTIGGGTALTAGTNITIVSDVVSVHPQGQGSGLDADLWDGQQSSIASPITGQALLYNGVAWQNANLPVYPTSYTLLSLTDVSLTSQTSGQALTWNGSHWVNTTLPTYPTSYALSGLTDVVITAQSIGQAITWNGATWVNSTLPTYPTSYTLSGLTDATIVSPSSGQVLTYNGSTWINATPSGGGSVNDYLHTLLDVSSPANPSQDSFLVFDTYMGKWTATTMGLASGFLGDVQLSHSANGSVGAGATGPAVTRGQVLCYGKSSYYSGSFNFFTNYTLQMTDLGDVDPNLGAASTGDVLTFNGSNWSYATPSSGGGSSAWSSITGTPTTVAGYGITDAVTTTDLSAYATTSSLTTAVGSIALATLTDVAVSSPSAGQSLVYDGTHWANTALTFQTLPDVLMDSQSVGQTLIFDGTKWANSPQPTIEQLNNVNVSGATNNQVLVWNAGSGKWINSAVPNNYSDFQTLTDASATAGLLGYPHAFQTVGGAAYIITGATQYVLFLPDITTTAVGTLVKFFFAADTNAWGGSGNFIIVNPANGSNTINLLGTSQGGLKMQYGETLEIALNAEGNWEIIGGSYIQRFEQTDLLALSLTASDQITTPTLNVGRGGIQNSGNSNLYGNVVINSSSNNGGNGAVANVQLGTGGTPASMYYDGANLTIYVQGQINLHSNTSQPLYVNGSPLSMGTFATLTSPNVGDTLTWNGTAWVNSTPAFVPGVQLPSYADDATAAAGGLALYGFYINGGVVQQRIV